MGWGEVKKIVIAALVLLFVSAFFCNCVLGAEEKTVFIRDGGVGDGSSFENAAEDFKDAVGALAESGGNIVVCGALTLDELVALSEKSGTSNGNNLIRVTSVYNGVDYRTAENAALYFGDGKKNGNIILDGKFLFENMDIICRTEGKSRAIICGGWETVFGEGISCKKEGNSHYPSIVGGTDDDITVKGSSITVKSGAYYNVVGGTEKGDYRGDLFLKIEGGVFEGIVSVSGVGNEAQHKGNAVLEVDGGTFYGSVGALTALSGEFEMTVSGGTFRKDIYAQGKYNTLNINGGYLQSAGQIRVSDYIPPVPETDGDGKAVETNAEDVKKTAVNINYYSGDVNKLKEKINGEGVEINVNTLGGIDAETAPLQSETAAVPKETAGNGPEEEYEETPSSEPSDTVGRYYLLGTKEKTVFAVIGIGALIALCVIILAYRSVYRKK